MRRVASDVRAGDIAGSQRRPVVRVPDVVHVQPPRRGHASQRMSVADPGVDDVVRRRIGGIRVIDRTTTSPTCPIVWRVLSARQRRNRFAGHLHTPAFSVVRAIRKNVIGVPKVVSAYSSAPAPDSLLRPQHQPDRKLTNANARLQSWHINCDSVDLAKR
jgi:hypothetical protein